MEPLELGILAINSSVGTAADDRTLLVAAKCRALLRGYDKRWRGAGYEPLQVEQLVVAPLQNPETQRTSRTWRVAGKLDLVAAYHGQRILFDHKTTSQDITDPNAPFWRQLQIEGQVSHYMLLEWQNGRKCDGAVWDVLRKPQTSPKKLTKAERAQVLATRRYFDSNVSDDTLQALTAEERETVELYELRLTHDCTKERPDWFFQRRAVPRVDNEILEYAAELWDHGQDILATHNNNRHTRNSGACMLYGSPCQFLRICSGYDQSDSDKWAQKTAVHNELPTLDGDGRDVLTNSRIRCYQTCRRKHFYQYELGIERIDEEEREALFFGSLWHFALEAWFSSQMKGTENGSFPSDSPGSELGQSNTTTATHDVGGRDEEW